MTRNMLAPLCQRCGEPHHGACERAPHEEPKRRGKGDKINRLRRRVDSVQWNGSRDELTGVLKGILDLLEDEL